MNRCVRCLNPSSTICRCSYLTTWAHNGLGLSMHAPQNSIHLPWRRGGVRAEVGGRDIGGVRVGGVVAETQES